jgi:hypothetical protein
MDIDTKKVFQINISGDARQFFASGLLPPQEMQVKTENPVLCGVFRTAIIENYGWQMVKFRVTVYSMVKVNFLKSLF